MLNDDGTRRPLRGVLHAHTVYSDGSEQMEHWVERARASGIDFIAVSDHAESFDRARMADYVALCAHLSDRTLLVIPGLEFSFSAGRIHILAYGIEELFRRANPKDLIEQVHGAGGLAVLAHPQPGATDLLDKSVREALDGVEVWNGRYNGLAAPNVHSIQLLRRLRRQRGTIWAYAGLDLHTPGDWGRLFVDVETDSLDRRAILQALAAGRFVLGGGRGIVIPSDGELSFLQEAGILVKRSLTYKR